MRLQWSYFRVFMGRRKKFVLEGVKIEKYAAEGKCIARWDEKVLFVKGVVPGDVADVFVFKNKTKWAEAKVNRLVEKSDMRVEAFCEHFGSCGGCKWQMLPYEQQLIFKEQQVKDQLSRIGGATIEEYFPILSCEGTTLYRNKLEFTFSCKQYLSPEELNTDKSFDKNVLGFHAPGLFDKVVPIEKCHLQAEPTNAIRNFVRDFAFEKSYTFYDARGHHGQLRNLVVRMNKKGEVLLNLIIGENNKAIAEDICQALQAHFPAIKSLHYTINEKMNDSIYDLNVVHYSGEDHIIETLEEFQFKISPKSFFQTNSKQAEKLYNVVRDFADCKGTETLYDLYCGTGSIGIFLKNQIGKLVGVETVTDAIADAKVNAQLNSMEHASFHAGDVIKVCNDAFFNEHGQPDIIILDPPRAGLHQKLIDKLLHIRAPKMVYVSCNPATQARDLALLSESYRITKSKAVDMFPHTHHIENVVQLILKND